MNNEMKALNSFVSKLSLEVRQKILSDFLEWQSGGISIDSAIAVQARRFAEEAQLLRDNGEYQLPMRALAYEVMAQGEIDPLVRLFPFDVVFVCGQVDGLRQFQMRLLASDLVSASQRAEAQSELIQGICGVQSVMGPEVPNESKGSSESRIAELEAVLREARDSFQKIDLNHKDRFLVSSLSSLKVELITRTLDDDGQRGDDLGRCG